MPSSMRTAFASSLRENVSRDCDAERFVALFRRYDPPVADIPDEHVAAMFISPDAPSGVGEDIIVRVRVGQSD